MPLITNDLSAMDAARSQMIDALEVYIRSLQDELKANELILDALKATIAAAAERESRRLENLPRPAILRRQEPDRDAG